MRDRVAYEALELAEQHPFDLLLTDVVMRGCPGRRQPVSYASRHLGLPVLFTSGYEP